MKKILLMMAALLLSVTSFAEDFDLVGTWYQYESDQEALDGIWVFNADGSGTLEEFHKGQSEGIDHFTYTFDTATNKLTVYFAGEEDDPSTMTITIVSQTKFTYSEDGDVLTWVKQATAISRLVVDSQPVTSYSLNGYKQKSPKGGLSIMRRADGSIVKVFSR